MKRRGIVKAVAVSAALIAAGISSQSALAQQKTVKVGVLHSLSGTMAISETVLKDVALMAFEEINAKGGVMGMKIEPIVVDPASSSSHGTVRADSPSLEVAQVRPLTSHSCASIESVPSA